MNWSIHTPKHVLVNSLLCTLRQNLCNQSQVCRLAVWPLCLWRQQMSTMFWEWHVLLLFMKGYFCPRQPVHRWLLWRFVSVTFRKEQSSNCESIVIDWYIFWCSLCHKNDRMIISWKLQITYYAMHCDRWHQGIQSPCKTRVTNNKSFFFIE